MWKTGGPDVPAARDAPLSPTLKRLPAARHNQARARISRRPLELNGLGRCGRGGVWGTKPLAPAPIGPTRRLLLGAVLVGAAGWGVGQREPTLVQTVRAAVPGEQAHTRVQAHACANAHVCAHVVLFGWDR